MPTTAAIAQRAVRASTQACKTPVYPEHQSSDNIGFFLACLLREQAQRDALHQLTREKSFPRKSQPLQHAVYHGITLHDEEIKKSIKYVIQDGMLPYAHAYTTYFDKQVAA